MHCAWRPESSGILERQHRTLKNALYVVSKELDQPWPNVIGQVVQLEMLGKGQKVSFKYEVEVATILGN